jgi:hypothetical protein
MNKFILINQMIMNMLLYQIMKVKIIILMQNSNYHKILFILMKKIIIHKVKIVI